jgi:hypothetical protein
VSPSDYNLPLYYRLGFALYYNKILTILVYDCAAAECNGASFMLFCKLGSDPYFSKSLVDFR